MADKKNGQFKKGHIPWNKGMGKNSPVCPKCDGKKSYSAKYCQSCSVKERTPWNKGLRGYNSGEKHPQWKGGISKKKNICDCGKVLSNYRAKQCKNCYWESMKGVYTESMKRGSLLGAKTLSKRNPTSIEIKVYQELKKRGLLFETQKIINGRFTVDAYIPKLNLVIEVDGDYWHSLERIKKKDKAENAYLKKCGYKLLRLSGTEVKNDEFINKLSERMID